ncbi:alpha/beta hydrolase [Clostridium vincentii]|uniref:Acetyl esterase n=1 Tax=Clostridium vincentii TaxID=52704 RepID=A0A2T0BB80_9CLOT|nr:alpha/beta hydrolase [Clostridium vincentii]PRR81150.1 acetyl esterase [Clostridium vincentii]
MKKIFKLSMLTFALMLILLSILFSGRISIYYKVFKKYSNYTGTVTSASFQKKSLEASDAQEIIYKSTNNTPLTLDLYKPDKMISQGSPVLIFVHGGSWAYGDKSLPPIFNPLLEALCEEGYSIISVEYELLDESLDFDKQISDIKDSIRWVNKNKDLYNFNAEEIGVIGVSAGAHLSLLSAYSDSNDFVDDEELAKFPCDIKYLIDFSGPTDLSTLDTSIAPEMMTSRIKAMSNKDEFMAKYSPIYFVKEGLPKTLIIHSEDDTMVPYINSLALYSKSKDFNNSVDFLTVQDTDHDLSNLTEENSQKIALRILTFIVNNFPL